MKLKIFNQSILTICLIFPAVFLVYLLSNPFLKDHYKHQAYLAYSLTQGHFDLINYPPSYHDIFAFKEKLYTAFSPFPIIFLAPLVAFFGTSTNQVLVSIIVGALNPVILFFILKKLKLSLNTIILTVIAFSFGTLNWYSAVIGTSWFFSHTITVFCLLVSLLALFNEKYILGGLFFGFAFTSRYPVFFALPAMFFFIKSLSAKKFFKLSVFFFLGIIPSLLLYFCYNFFRFGSIFESGYQYANAAYAYLFSVNGRKTAEFSLFYLPRNLYIFLFRGFDFISQFPFLKPDWQGLSIFFTSPFLLYSLKIFKSKKLALSLWLAIFFILGTALTYFSNGFYQFGYRYLLDFLPFLIILTAFGIENSKTFLPKIFLIGTSIIFNLLGVYWGLKLGW